MMIIQRLVDRREHSLRDGGTLLNVVGPIGEHLRLDDGHQPVLLTDDCVAGQTLRVLLDGQLRRLGGTDLKDGTPLGESRPGLIVLAAPCAERIEALSGGLAVGSGELYGALVDLDPRDDAVFLEDLDEGLAVGGFLVESLLEEDDAGEAGEGVWGGEEELP